MIQGVPSPPSFAEQVADATGLAGMLALGAVRRCCGRAGIEMDRMKPRDVEKLLPQLEAVLLVYLSSSEANAAVDRIQRLAEADDRPAWFGRPRDAE